MDFDFDTQNHQPGWTINTTSVVTSESAVLSDGSLINIDVITLQNSAPELPVHPEFAFTDGSIELQTLDRRFWVHEFQLAKFEVLANCIQEAREQATEPGTGPGIRLVVPLFIESDEFVDTLRVIYTPFVPSPHTPLFDPLTFISALRIATLYDYSDLRQFAIRELEERYSLTAIERFELADELSLFDWKAAILSEFCDRSEPLSQEEMEILGEDSVAHILDYREKYRNPQPPQTEEPQTSTDRPIDPRKRLNQTESLDYVLHLGCAGAFWIVTFASVYGLCLVLCSLGIRTGTRGCE